jgi:hypothetical protein
MSETITAVKLGGTASGKMTKRTEFGTIRQETYAGVPLGSYVIGRNGYRIAELERTFDGWELRIGDSTDVSVGLRKLGTYPGRLDALRALVRHELPALPVDYVTVGNNT